MGCCLGCHTKPQPNYSINERLKGQNLHILRASKASISEGFWTASTHEMDNSAVQSCGSTSSASTLHDAHGACNSINPPEFINHDAMSSALWCVNHWHLIREALIVGRLLWNQNRQKWVGKKGAENQVQQLRKAKLSWNATYDSLLSKKKPFHQPIPLGEMVDFLVDIWEQEGMYD